MRTTGNRGVYLEQNKMPAIGKEIRLLISDNFSHSFLNREVPEQPQLLAPHEIIKIAKEAKIVDDTDGKLLWEKLAVASEHGVNSIVVDCIDDEPYISSQIAPFMQYSNKIALGIRLAARAIGTKSMEIQIYKGMLDIDIKIPRSLEHMKITKVIGRYPAEYRERLTKQKKRNLVVGACSMLYLYRAVYLCEYQQTCFVTVAGDAVANPGNYEVSIGASMLGVIEATGLIREPRLLIAGGSMTGYAVAEPAKEKVTPITRGILAFTTSSKDFDFPCIGCGRCKEVCPMKLSPFFIVQVIKSKSHHGIDICDADICTGCGTCSYVCPAKIDLSKLVMECGQIIRGKTHKI